MVNTATFIKNPHFFSGASGETETRPAGNTVYNRFFKSLRLLALAVTDTGIEQLYFLLQNSFQIGDGVDHGLHRLVCFQNGIRGNFCKRQDLLHFFPLRVENVSKRRLLQRHRFKQICHRLTAGYRGDGGCSRGGCGRQLWMML